MKRATFLKGIVMIAMFTAFAPFAHADALKSQVELTTKECGSKETALCNLIADAIREIADSDIAFVSSSAFNEVSFPKGPVTKEDILKALEFRDDNVIVVKLTAAQILKALEHSLYLFPKTNSAFLHFSGITVEVKPEAEKGKRVVSVKLDDKLLENGKSYKVAMPSPLAKGALAYSKIWKSSKEDKDTDKTLETAILDYLKKKTLIEKSDERLILPKKKTE